MTAPTPNSTPAALFRMPSETEILKALVDDESCEESLSAHDKRLASVVIHRLLESKEVKYNDLKDSTVHFGDVVLCSGSLVSIVVHKNAEGKLLAMSLDSGRVHECKEPVRVGRASWIWNEVWSHGFYDAMINLFNESEKKRDTAALAGSKRSEGEENK